MSLSKVKHLHSEDSIRSELLTQVPPTDISVLSTEYVKFGPKVPTSNDSEPLVYEINADPAHYLDFYNHYFYGRMKIVKHDNTAIGSTDFVAPSHCFFHACMADREVDLNGVTIESFGSHNALNGYMTTLLGSPPSEHSAELKNMLFYPPKVQDNFENKTDDTCGFAKRAKLCADGKSVEFIGKLPICLANQTRYLPPGSKVEIKIQRASAKSCLDAKINVVSSTDSTCPYKYIIEDGFLVVPKHKVDERVILAQQQELEKNGYLAYPMYVNNVRTYTIGAGNTSHTAQSFISGTLPQQIYIGTILNSAANGNLKESIYNLQHFDVRSIGIGCGAADPFYKIVEYDIEHDKYLAGLQSIKNAAANTLLGQSVNRENFKNGNVITGFDLSSLHKDGLSLIRKGDINIDIKFWKPLEKAITVIVFTVDQVLMTIDANNKVSLRK